MNGLKYKTDTAHRSLNSDFTNGVLSCGFMYKPTKMYTQKDITFQRYGAFFLLDGHGLYKDQNGFIQQLKPGCFVQRIPGIQHTTEVIPDGKWLEFFICFGKSTWKTLSDLHLLSSTPVLFPGENQNIYYDCLHLLQCFRQYPEPQSSYLYTMVQNFAIDLTAMGKRRSFDCLNQKMLKACELLSKTGESIMTVSDTANSLNLQYDTFRKKFKNSFGISPVSYQLRQRINHSKQLLLDTDKSLNEIALTCNFSDEYAYSKAFKKHTGQSPCYFRKQRLGM